MGLIKNLDRIQYTMAHRKAFRKLEKKLLGHNTIRGLLHDFDKVILMLFIDKEQVHQIHVAHSRHHNKAHTKSDYIQMIVDWECARFTKPDKPLNARETLYKYYPNLVDKIEPLLDTMGL